MDHLEIAELNNLADTSARFRTLITDQYMIPLLQIPKKLIHIGGQKHFHQLTTDDLFIGTFQIILRFLRNFGHLITKLKFIGNSSFSSDEKFAISEYIEKYCSQTLADIHLIESNSYLTNDAKRTFPNVLKVTISSFSQLNISQIHRIFPNMLELALTNDLLAISNTSTWKQLYNSLESMPQLRALSLSRIPSYDQLEFINKILPNLESLAIGYDPSDFPNSIERNVHFANVRHFQVNVLGGTQGITNDSFPVVFDQLATLEMKMNEFASIPIKCIEENVALTSLTLPFEIASRISNNIKELKHLNELKVKWSTDVNAADLMSLMNELNQLDCFTFIVSDLPDKLINLYAVKGILQDEWNVTSIGIEAQMTAYIVAHITVERVNVNLTLNKLRSDEQVNFE